MACMAATGTGSHVFIDDVAEDKTEGTEDGCSTGLTEHDQGRYPAASGDVYALQTSCSHRIQRICDQILNMTTLGLLGSSRGKSDAYSALLSTMVWGLNMASAGCGW